MLRGSTPVRLSQIDMSPFVRAAKMNEAASLNLSNAVTKSISDFTKKQEEKRQKNASIESIMGILDLDKKTATAVYNDETVREAFKFQQKAQYEAARATASAKEIEASQLRALYPNMPEAIILDIVNDRLMPERTEGGETTGLFQSKSSGQIIDLRDFIGTPRPGPGPEPEPEREPDADGFEAPTLRNQGLYGRLVLLDERKDSPTGLEQAVVGGIDTFFSSVFGDSPVNLDPDVRSFQNDLENNLNIFANSLKVGTRYSSTEQRDMVQAMEEMSSGLSTGAFKSTEQLKAAMVSLDKRFNKEIQRLERLLNSRRLNTTAKSNYEGMLSQVKNAKELLGVDVYNQTKLSGLDFDKEQDDLDNLPF